MAALVKEANTIATVEPVQIPHEASAHGPLVAFALAGEL
jgi:hypothetical protein